jgi:hypothetical protein
MSHYTETVKARIYPSTYAKLREWAEEERMSISRLFRQIIADHIKEKTGYVDPPRPRRPRKPFTRPNRSRPAQGGYVYIIKCAGLYKIGRAVDVQKRIGEMTLPMKPELVSSVFSLEYGALEKGLHAMFAACRKHGEWFELVDEQLEQLISLLKRS